MPESSGGDNGAGCGFARRLAAIDVGRLRDYLLTLSAPCYESTLLKVVFPGMDILRADPLTLYQHHFILFHCLYRLQAAFYEENRYLHVHFMRTFLLDYPAAGRCRHYDPWAGRFCSAPRGEDPDYCDRHFDQMGKSAVERLSTRYFYLDAENFDRFDAATAEEFVSGAWDLLTHYDAFRESLRVLDLPEAADLAMVKRKFRHLAMRHHPDRGARSAERFNEINRAYRLLVRVMPEPLR